ncbi:MAG: hypothetical protein K8R77_09605 [Anaerolineaceae bacterium]|nr:hypothetical protein [Anaerolineaceae bacterium]
MCSQTSHSPVDYLVIGHLTQDITPSGPVLGGTTSYAALTAAAMGLRVGVLTTYPQGENLPELANVQVAVQPTARATTFENLTTPQGRMQIIHHMADALQPEMVPFAWRLTPMIHFGPVAHEIPESMLDIFPDAHLGITPQGWMRRWDVQGKISKGNWSNAARYLARASAVVLSLEDVNGNEETILRYRSETKLLVVTEANKGARLYFGEQMHHFEPPAIREVDATGAGDIFAAIFFCHFFQTGNMTAAAQLATLAAANSIARPGLKGTPQPAEVRQYLAEINETT